MSDNNFEKYYLDEAENIDGSGTMIYVDRYVRLEDCKVEFMSNLEPVSLWLLIS